MNLKFGWILLIFYFITVGMGILLVSFLSTSLVVFAGTAYTGGDSVALIHDLAESGITEDTFLSLIQVSKYWILLSPCGLFVFAIAEWLHYRSEKKKLHENQQTIQNKEEKE